MATIDSKKDAWWKCEKIIASYILLVVFLVGFLVGTMMSYEIPAIEVYRGNTSLELTRKYRDGVIVKVDSTVVLKNK